MSELMRRFERDTLSAAWHAKRVWLTQVVANLLLLAIFYGWLFIPDRKGWQVAASFVIAVIWLTIALWLHAATFQFFAAAHAAPESWRMSWRRSARNIPAFAICVAIVVAEWYALGWALDHQHQIAGWFHHINPAFIRTRVSVRTFSWMTHVKIILVFLWIIPAYLLPLVREGAVRGFGAFTRGWASAARSFWHLRWWIGWFVLMMIAHLPFHLAFPKHFPSTLAAQAVVAFFRLGFAYLFLITVYVITVSALGRLRHGESPSITPPVPVESAPKV